MIARVMRHKMFHNKINTFKIVSGRGTYDNMSHGLHYWFDTVRHGSGLVTARFVLPTERFQICVNSKVELP